MVDSYDFPFAYRGVITLNGHRTSTGGIDTADEADTYRVNSFDYSRVQQRDQREPLHLLSGGDLGTATAAFRYISMAGMIRASNPGKLDDLIAQLMYAFDVEEAQRESPSTEGVGNLDFTGISEINNGRGTLFTDERGRSLYRVPERFLARPAGFPIITNRRSGGDSAGFALELVCADKRRYCQTAEAVVLNSGNGFTAPVPNWDAAHGITVDPFITIVMAGAGSTNLTLNITGSSPILVLDMSAETAGTFTVDCATGVIKKGGTHKAALRASAVTSPFLKVLPGNEQANASNTTGVTSITFGYRQARG